MELGHPEANHDFQVQKLLADLVTDSDEDLASGSDLDVEEPAIPGRQTGAEEEQYLREMSNIQEILQDSESAQNKEDFVEEEDEESSDLDSELARSQS